MISSDKNAQIVIESIYVIRNRGEYDRIPEFYTKDFAAHQPDSPSVNRRPGRDGLRVGVPVGPIGANAVLAPSVVQQSELAQGEISAAGGIFGRQLEIKFYDDQSGAGGALKAFNTDILQVRAM